MTQYPPMAAFYHHVPPGTKYHAVSTHAVPVRPGLENLAEYGEYDAAYRPDVDVYYQQSQQPLHGEWQQKGWYHMRADAQPLQTTPSAAASQEFQYHRGYEQLHGPLKPPALGPPPMTPPDDDGPVLHSPEPNYKPPALRWGFLSSLLVVVLTLIGLMVYACETLPVEENPGPVATIAQAGLFTTTVTLLPTTASSSSSSARLRGRVPPSGAFGQNGTVILTVSSTTSTPLAPTASSSTSSPMIYSAVPTQGNFGTDGSVVLTVPITTTTSPHGATLTPGRPSSDFGQDGAVTLTVTNSQASSAGGGGSESQHTVITTTLAGVVSTIVGQTTVDGTVSSFTSLKTLSDVVVTSTIGPSYLTASAQTLTNSLGVPTATVELIPTGTGIGPPITTTLTNSNGVPTATLTEYPAAASQQPTEEQIYYFLPASDYFMGSFLPVLVGILLTLPLRMVDLSAKQYEPFRELASQHGASAAESLDLKTSGLYGLLTSIRALFGGRALIFLTTLLVISSALATSVATEAVSLKLHGSCGTNNFAGCASVLSVFLVPAYVTMALLGLMAILLGIILIVLSGWRSGVNANPWSIASIASLTTNRDMRALLLSTRTGDRSGDEVGQKALLAGLQGRTFALRYFVNESGATDYGIVPQGGPPIPDGSSSIYSLYPEIKGRRRETRHAFVMLSYWLRLVFLALLSGLLALVLYYNNTNIDSGFERFMDSQGFAVRFVFTLTGICITFFWSSFFTSLAIMSPYQLLSMSPRYARDSVLLGTPIHALTGLWPALRSRDLFLVVIGITSLMSEAMPVLLSHVPFAVAEMYVVQMACAYTTVGILGIMWLVIVASFFVRWQHVPVDPSTLAGAMYYVCDSAMLAHFEGVSVLSRTDRDWRVNELGLRYRFGSAIGVSGEKRTGVDAVSDLD